MRNSHRRFGFTVIELTVAVVIIAALLALLLPAIQMAREYARRTQCVQQLRQIGTALHSYHVDHACFPGGVVFGYSPHAMLLPYVGHDVLYNATNFHVSAGGSVFANRANGTVAAQVVQLFLCPSDAQPSGGGWTNYSANTGSGRARWGWNGVFKSGGVVRLSDIVDGASATAAMSEWVRGPGNDGSTNDRKAWVFRTFPRLFTDVEFDQFVSLCANISSVTAAIASGGKGETWLMAGYPHTWYNHVLTPNGNSCQNEMEYKYGSLAASSRHGSGVNLLLADGSARFVNESIDLAVWRALGSREGGEQVEEF